MGRFADLSALRALPVLVLMMAVAGCARDDDRPRLEGKRNGPVTFEGDGGFTFAPFKEDGFVSVPVCVDSDEPVSISELSFTAKPEGAEPRFMVNFDGPGEGSWGAARVSRLTPNFVDPEDAEGEIRPCESPQDGGQMSVEIAFILDRDGLVGAYADGFEMTYTYRGREYQASSRQRIGICASTGPNPEPIVENCAEIAKD
ncbi:MAG: hypothetical protein ACRCYQ_09750 [Nocardioides sp.]